MHSGDMSHVSSDRAAAVGFPECVRSHVDGDGRARSEVCVSRCMVAVRGWLEECVSSLGDREWLEECISS